MPFVLLGLKILTFPSPLGKSEIEYLRVCVRGCPQDG